MEFSRSLSHSPSCKLTTLFTVSLHSITEKERRYVCNSAVTLSPHQRKHYNYYHVIFFNIVIAIAIAIYRRHQI